MGRWDTNHWVPRLYLSIALIALVLWLFLFYQFLRNRHVFPIRERWPSLIAVASFAVFTNNFILLIEVYTWDTFPCWADVFVTYFMVHVASYASIIRGWKLYFNYSVARQAMRSELGEESLNSSNGGRSEVSSRGAAVSEVGLSDLTGREAHDELEKEEKEEEEEEEEEKEEHLEEQVPTNFPEPQKEIPEEHPVKFLLPDRDMAQRRDQMGWFIRHRNFGNPLYLTILFVILIVLQFIFFLVTWFSARLPGSTVIQGCAVAQLNYASYAVYGLQVAAVVFIGINIRKLSDNFFIKKELFGTGLVALGGLVIAGLQIAVLKKYETEYSTKSLNITFLLYGMEYYMLYYPLQKAFKGKFLMHAFHIGDVKAYLGRVSVRRKSQSTSGNDAHEYPMIDLAVLLSHKGGLRRFTNYLTDELSVETILFWRAVEAYRNSKVNLLGVLVQEAREIFEKYVDEGSPLQVNLPFEMVKNIRSFLESLSSFSPPSAPKAPEVDATPVHGYTSLPLDASILSTKDRETPPGSPEHSIAPPTPLQLQSTLQSASPPASPSRQTSFFSSDKTAGSPASVTLNLHPSRLSFSSSCSCINGATCQQCTSQPLASPSSNTPTTFFMNPHIPQNSQVNNPTHSGLATELTSVSVSSTPAVVPTRVEVTKAKTTTSSSPPRSSEMLKSGSTTSQTVQQLKLIFQDAQKEIFDLMRNDPYVRFCKTAEYVAAYKQIKAKEQLRKDRLTQKKTLQQQKQIELKLKQQEKEKSRLFHSVKKEKSIKKVEIPPLEKAEIENEKSVVQDHSGQQLERDHSLDSHEKEKEDGI